MGRGRERGASLVELAVALALLAIGAAVVLPAASRMRDAGRIEAGARYMATLFAAKRWTAVAESRSMGLHFEQDGEGWAWREAVDSNGNGIRTGELRSGTDAYRSGTDRLERRIEGVRVGLLPDRPVPEVPPGTDLLLPGGDPVRFGRSDVVSFSPDGRASSGTLYVTDGRGGLGAVVLFGPTARTRVWRWRDDLGRWTR
jgi:hypothetical protein